MKVEFYEYDGKGYIVDPESDTKERTVILLGKQIVKCNPRKVVIYVTGGAVDEKYAKLEELKAYCGDNKVVFVCPKADNCDALVETYKYITKNYLDLNIKPQEMSIKSDASHREVATELADYILDEFDMDFGETEIFEL
ncbi:hypothetical protein GCWU000282_00893 [Catonella morbi ATCC 51271]|uniref:Uncharacterized protein n=1 Tax=Catonella morbi ATCC 51271 TaxID=592026 RepID=V2Y462_9FIRM|nr:hypothetical protein [Catonella morbi]ESL03728.1 hypothetical protein GCWU000282_00893 [Catonella morbi ATCC 51271]